MANKTDFINKEIDTWGKIYTDITYAISEVSPFLDESQLRKRKYYSKLFIIKEYMEKLNSSKATSKQSKFLGLFKSDDTISNLNNYKDKNKDSFTQFTNCSQCACLNCIKECNFRSCVGCRPDSYIKKCDKEKINVRSHENFTLDLTNNNTGKASKYKVLATLEDSVLDRLYIILENILDMEDKFVLYYYPGISSEDFGEITDADEFDFVVETYQQSDY